MRKRFLDKELLIFGPIYFFLSFINLRVKLYLTPDWFNGVLAYHQKLLLQFNYANNEQSRLLQFYIPETFHRLFSLSIEHAYILQRWIFVFLAFVCFHKYLRKWFSVQESFSGVLFLAAIMPLSYFNHLQESAPLLLLTFLLGLWAIREGKITSLIVVFLIGGLNNETMLILPLVYFLFNYNSSKFRDLVTLCRNTFLVGLPLLLTVGPIRYINRNRPHLGGAWHLPDNLRGILNYLLHANFFDLYKAHYLYIFFIFAAFWIYAFVRYKEKPFFLRRASLMIPFFIVPHLLTGIICEVRQMVPLSFIVIPMALFYIYPSKSRQDNSKN